MSKDGPRDELPLDALIPIDGESIEELPLDALVAVDTETVAELPLDALVAVDTQTIAELPLDALVAVDADPLAELPLDALTLFDDLEGFDASVSDTAPQNVGLMGAREVEKTAPSAGPVGTHSPSVNPVASSKGLAPNQREIEAATVAADSPSVAASPAQTATTATTEQKSEAKDTDQDWPFEPLPPGAIADALQKHVDPASPAPMRLMAAKAMVPMSPRDQFAVLYQLSFDGVAKIAAIARKSLRALPERIVSAVAADSQVAAPLLSLVAHLTQDANVIETLLLNKVTPDSAFAYLAEHANSERLVEIIANNQQRLLRDNNIVRGLKRNPHTLKSTLERVIDFMVRSGVLLADMSEFSESFSRLNQKEIEAAIASVEVPFELLAPDEQQRLRLLGKAPLKMAEVPTLELDGDLSFDDLDLLAIAEEGEETSAEEQAAIGRSIRQMLRTLTVSQQVKVAMLGNKEVRGLLLRSTIRLVAEAAIRSPRLTDMEVIAAASSRAVQDVVIRYISNNREWTRLYQVKIALCNNPKTPLAASMNLLRGLRMHDLRSIAKSKNVPSALSQQANRIQKQKSGA